MKKQQLIKETVQLINSIKWQVDAINTRLCELGAENGESELHTVYMNFPTYDSLKELISIVKGEEELEDDRD